jgi:hypothetical protein
LTSTSTTISNIDTFHAFSKLAPELRLKVWYEALPGPAIVEIDFCRGIKQWYNVKESQATTCSLLVACKDSRDTYLKHYVTLFKQYTTTPFIPRTGGWNLHGACGYNFFATNTTPISYFSPLVDTLYIGASAEENLNIAIDALEYLQQVPCLANIRFLGCEFLELKHGLIYGDAPNPLLLFPSLEEFSVVVDDYSYEDVTEGSLRPGGQIEWFGEQTEWLGDPMKGDETSWVQAECKEAFWNWKKEVIQRGSTSPIPSLSTRRITRGGVLPEDCNLDNIDTNREEEGEEDEEEYSDEAEEEEEEQEEEQEEDSEDGDEYGEDYDEEASSGHENENSD